MASYQARRRDPLLDQNMQAMLERRGRELLGLVLLGLALCFALMLGSYSPNDPGWMVATEEPAQNLLGRFGAGVSSTLIIIGGMGAWSIPIVLSIWGLRFVLHRGAERALSCAVDELNLVMSASESHNRSNLRMTRDTSFAGLAEVTRAVQGTGVAINVSLSCAFGCPMEGDVPVQSVLDWCQRYVQELGAHGVTLCDTTGMAYPTQVTQLTQAFRERWPDTELTLHFHNTRGMGLANVLAAMDAGADRFDASFGGIGGCPYAPGASGNVCTEEIVHALNLMGYNTGVDLTRLLAAAK